MHRSVASQPEIELLEELNVVEVIEPIGTGITEPYRCRLSDSQLYAVKGRGALTRGLIAEAVCACLGHRLKLPIPPAALCYVEADLAKAVGDPNFERSVGMGWCFGSLWREPVVPLRPTFLEIFDRRVVAMIYVFDHWVMNGDRTLTEHGGNPNLLVQLEVPSLFAIDHNLAFSDTYKPSELRLHAGRQAWLDERQSLVFIDECRQALSYAAAFFPQIGGMLPSDWLDDEPGCLERIANHLNRYKAEQFWMEME